MAYVVPVRCHMSHQDPATDTRLATYGTLSPGRANHRHLAALTGFWRRGTVKGRLVNSGWGASLGYPGLILDPSASLIQVDLFESRDLPQHWLRLDDFEGSGYKRMVTRVQTTDGDLDAWIYVVVEADSSSDRARK
jgi:gamma-glutamylcyclotransferase (GGCT)/AIG2-like uncharacterized protein YtfP